MNNSEITGNAGEPRVISKRLYNFLSAELLLWREKEVITEQQFGEISGMYEQKSAFAGTLMNSGMTLLGCALLSYIAANWLTLSMGAKISLIISLYVGSALAAFYFEKISSNISRGLLMLSSFAYGGGIFLIAQIFHDGSHYTNALFWWMIGLIPAFLILKDKHQFILIQIIMLPYLYGTIPFFDFYSLRESGIWEIFNLFKYQIAMTAVLWALWLRTRDRITFNLNVLISVLIVFGLSRVSFNDNFTNICLNMAALGVLMTLLSHFDDDLTSWGILLIGVCGIILSYSDIWQKDNYLSAVGLIKFAQYAKLSVVIGISTAVLMLFFMRKGNILANVLFSALILRYYLDTFYDFIPKSAFFAIGGILVVIAAIAAGKSRKHSRGGDR